MWLRAPLSTFRWQVCTCAYTHRERTVTDGQGSFRNISSTTKTTPFFLLSQLIHEASISSPYQQKPSLQPQTCLFHWRGNESLLSYHVSFTNMIIYYWTLSNNHTKKKHYQLHFWKTFDLSMVHYTKTESFNLCLGLPFCTIQTLGAKRLTFNSTKYFCFLVFIPVNLKIPTAIEEYYILIQKWTRTNFILITSFSMLVYLYSL